MIGFEESKNSVIMKEIILFGLFGLAVNAFGQTTCVDPLACNFTELGECEFLDDNGMPCVTEGCAIPGACNFNPGDDAGTGAALNLRKLKRAVRRACCFCTLHLRPKQAWS